jgi:aerobic carbon-monoxide dehydrogenase medium subunit
MLSPPPDRVVRARVARWRPPPTTKEGHMQTPRAFEYERATSVDHAISLLERLGPEARLVSGGHSLLPMMKLRLAQPEVLIDINPLAAELGQIRVQGDEIRVGAMVRHAELLASPVIAEHFSILIDAERVIADPIVRNRGTVGGSICQADPSEDLSAAFAALKAQIVIRSSAGERVVSSRDIHVGPYETQVGPAEMCTEVRIPIRGGSGSAYEKVERRVGDWAVAAAGAWVQLRDGVIADAGIGLTALGVAHFCAPEAEAVLIGNAATDDVIARAAAAAAAITNPPSDQRGPADYKTHLAEVLTRRALNRSIARARGL